MLPGPAATALRWLGRLLLLLVLGYFSYSMLLMGYICVGTGLQPYGREHRLFYLTAGPLLLAGGLAILVFTIRWLARILRPQQGEKP
jgi:hypothetical protein